MPCMPPAWENYSLSRSIPGTEELYHGTLIPVLMLSICPGHIGRCSPVSEICIRKFGVKSNRPRSIEKMYLSTKGFLTILLLGVAAISSAQVTMVKCHCNGRTEDSIQACKRVGAEFGYGCGFQGCCVAPGRQQRRFISTCRRLGYGFARCDDCAIC
jgi:hypothetical protein